MFLINTQILLFYFGNTYLTLLMVTNIVSIQDLKGNATIYFGGAILAIFTALLPSEQFRNLQIKKKVLRVILLVLIIVELSIFKTFGAISPLTSLSRLPFQAYEQHQQYLELKELTNDAREKFYKSEIENYVELPKNLKNKPNIILIFTEGLSQNIIDDGRQIMPNLKEYQKKSLVFSNYYNHTAATYRGIIGQLYSGYEMRDADPNYLISLQELLTKMGYRTTFINTEPSNSMFTSYLKSFGFQYLLGAESTPENGNYFSDKEAYVKLWDTIEDNNNKEPYFICIYTFGTHATFDSEDEVFGDGTNAELNKFYNADFQFGDFMQKFENSPLTNNTLLVFTADHATVKDAGFTEAFPEYQREAWFTDRIPLMFYYKGILPQNIDVDGRNSLDLAPSVLDYLDITAPNYFLGKSLFAPKEKSSFIETIYNETVTYKCTNQGNVKDLSEEELKRANQTIKYYFALSMYYKH